MQKFEIEPRENWRSTVYEQGLVYADTEHPDGSIRPYWNESMYYSFDLDTVIDLENATNNLHQMSIEAAHHILQHPKLAERIGIPAHALPKIRQSWDNDEPSLYGRFDLSHNPTDNTTKMLEYNADTPTGLVEGSLIQWLWLQDRFPVDDQWNSLHERLVQRWSQIMRSRKMGAPVLHFASIGPDESWEDYMTVAYLRDTAEEAGISTVTIPSIANIGWLAEGKTAGWLDHEGNPISTLFKLYPWEWLTSNDPEETSPTFLNALCSTEGPNTRTQFIEPAWKMLLSNKGLLPVMWQMFEGHPHLLPSYFEEQKPKGLKHFVRKPLLSREGANVSIVNGNRTLEAVEGEYGEEGYIVQAFHEGADFTLDADPKTHVYPILGAWVVGGEAAGMGIRQARGNRSTGNLSEFVPHVVRAEHTPQSSARVAAIRSQLNDEV